MLPSNVRADREAATLDGTALARKGSTFDRPSMGIFAADVAEPRQIACRGSGGWEIMSISSSLMLGILSMDAYSRFTNGAGFRLTSD